MDHMRVRSPWLEGKGDGSGDGSGGDPTDTNGAELKRSASSCQLALRRLAGPIPPSEP